RRVQDLAPWIEPERRQVLEVAAPAAASDEVRSDKAATLDRIAVREEKVAELRSTLSDKKRALLKKLMRGKAAAAVAPDAIPRRPREELAGLSFAQERFWFLDRLY